MDYKSSLVRYKRYLESTSEKPLLRASMFLILSLVLTILMVTLALRPTLITISTLLGQIREQKKVAQQLSTKIQNLQKAADELEINRESLALLDQALPTTPNISTWIEQVQTHATDSNVTINSLSLGATVFARRVPQLEIEVAKTTFSMAVTGQYDDILSFVDQLERMLRVTQLSDVQISRDTEGQLQVSLRGAIAYEKK